MINGIPAEAMVVVGVLIAGMVLCCLRVMGSELEHDLKVHELRVQARELRNQRYQHAMTLQRQAEQTRLAQRAEREARRVQRRQARDDAAETRAENEALRAAA